jgi:predicted ATPase
LAEQVLRENDGEWRVQLGEPALEGVPNSLRRMIKKRLKRLSAEDQRMLEVASVVGVEFTAAAVTAGIGQTLERIDEACAALARTRWLLAVGEQTWPDGTVSGGYRFGHALYQQVLYGQIPAARRARLHQRIGMRLETGFRDKRGARAAELAGAL